MQARFKKALAGGPWHPANGTAERACYLAGRRPEEEEGGVGGPWCSGWWCWGCGAQKRTARRSGPATLPYQPLPPVAVTAAMASTTASREAGFVKWVAKPAS